MTLHIFVANETPDPSLWNGMFNELYKLQNEKAINAVSATASGVLAGSSQVLIDKFLDSTGQNNTVDTGAGTTAEYRTGNIYICPGSSSIAEASFETVASWTYSETEANYSGARSSAWASKGTYSYLIASTSAIADNSYAQILQSTDVTSWNNICFDYNVTLGGGVNYLTAKLYFGATELWSKTLNAAESGTISIDCSAINGTQDIIFKVINLTGTDISVPATNLYIDNITTQYTDSIVQSAVVTIPTGMTKIMITPLMSEYLTGSDTITFDASIDNGSNYTTGILPNAISNITSANGTQLILKMNLNTHDGTTTPKVLGWLVDLD